MTTMNLDEVKSVMLHNGYNLRALDGDDVYEFVGNDLQHTYINDDGEEMVEGVASLPFGEYQFVDDGDNVKGTLMVA